MGLVRFILAIGVVLCHTSTIYGYTPINGNLAVQCFFIISGFYMTMILNEKYTTKASNKTFYTNRALKIYPIYWLLLLGTIVWSIIVFKYGYPGILTHYRENWPLSNLTIGYLIVANIFLIGLDWIFLFGLKDGNLFFTSNFNTTKPAFYNFAFNNVAWSVGLELLFYLIAPFILRKNLIYIFGILLISLAIKIILASNGLIYAPWDYMFFPTQLMFFMGGAISYHLYRSIKFKKVVLFIISIAYIFIILFYYEFFIDSSVKTIVLFVSTIIAIPCLFKLTKHSGLDRYLGDLSYPIYISQSLIIMATISQRFPKPFGWGATVSILCIITSIILHHLVIKPIEKIRIKKASLLTQTAII